METLSPTSRAVKLREQTCQGPMMAELPQNTWGPRRDLLLWEGWAASGDQPTTRLRRCASLAYRMDHEAVVINDHELIVGCPDLSPLTPHEQHRLAEVGTMAGCMPPVRGIYDHMAMDYAKLIEVGVEGLVAEIEERRRALDPHVPDSIRKDEFYSGCLLELRALLRLAGRYAARARALAQEPSPERARELREIADILEKVPARPAETFREALQSIHFYTFMLWGDYQLGRPDQYLIGLYRADIAAGRLTPESALELIDNLCLLYSAYHPKGSAVGFMVGGRDAAGDAVHNELTYLFVQSIAHTRMAYPSIGLCVHEETPEDLLDLAVEMLARGYSHPAIFNDAAITRGLMDLGMPERDARHYVHSSCVEITPCGQSGCWVFSPTINTPALLLEIMRDCSECGGVAELLTAYERALRARLAADLRTHNLWQLERSRNGTDSLLSSCLVNDCLKAGRSVDDGGANYNFIMPTFLGLANLVDSIAAIKTLVFDERELTMAGFYQILMDDFAGSQDLRQRIINRLPHFGNNEPQTDGLMREITGMLARSCEGLVTWFCTRAIPGAYSYQEHMTKGRETPATPDGRMAYTALSAASSPVQGRDVNGPTAAILSATCWDQTQFMGGVAINFKFQPLGSATRSSMKAVIKTVIARGGVQLQVNCVSTETLLAAREDPQDHRDLVVRIGGYSDFFTALMPEMQDEIVRRTGHV
jgi:trans-4-hydroxy-L-proline dehydratase